MQLNELIHKQANDVLAVIDSRVPELISKPEQMARHLAAAGLFRCCVLLRGILALDKADLSPLGHILARQHWETWLVSFHLLMRGDDAVQQATGDDIHWKRRLSDALRLGQIYYPNWGGPEGKVNYKALADGLPALLH